MRNKILVVVAALGLMVSLSARATTIGFTGDWAPGTWTTTFVGDVLPPGTNNDPNDGSVNAAGAPISITITGGDDPNNPDGSFNSCVGGGLFGCEIRFNHDAQGKSPINFVWSYTTQDVCGAQCDQFGVVLNGGLEQLLSDPGGLATQSGFFSTGTLPLSAFAFFISCGADCAGGPATVTISEFVVPEPASMALLGLGLLGLGVMRRKTGA